MTYERHRHADAGPFPRRTLAFRLKIPVPQSDSSGTRVCTGSGNDFRTRGIWEFPERSCMDCADAKLRMEPCASGALVPEELALFEEHIAACEGCRLELELVRAMGKNGDEKAGAKNDDWTLDRIFGAEATKMAATPVSESEALAIAPLTAGADQAAGPSSEEASAPESAALFETTPNPMPPEQAAAPASASSGEPADASGAESVGFDEPNPVSASFDDATTQVLENRASAQADAPVAPAPTPPSPTRPTTAPPSNGENSWDFEPADAKPEASLPEGSLFFAEETLARQGEAKKGKNTAKRMVVWGAGALVGIALLAISLWVGLSVREDGASINAPIPTATSTTPPGAPDAAPESLAAPEGGAAEVPGATTQEIVTQPADEAVAKPPAKALGARALSGGGVPSIPTTSTRSGSQPVAPRSMTGAPAASAAKGATTPSGSGAPKQSTTAPDAATSKAASGTASHSAGTRPTLTEELDPEQLELRAPPPAPPTTPEQNVPFNGGAKSADGSQASPKTATPPVVAPPVDAAPPAPPADQVQRPIDRLHLATVTAEQASDLVTLRKLKDTWKGLVRTSVGPDRARAKRELADCLWAIQSLTGRTSDKRDALAAYREYLLNAPAGGADPRTVARMRQLEDALAESK